MKQKIRKTIAVTMIAALGITLSGCYGSFNMTKKVHDWNGSLGNKFVQEAVFIAFNIIPVYGVSVFIDAIILNTVEFWTGNNPLALHEGVNHIKMHGVEYIVDVTDQSVRIHDKDGVLVNELIFNAEENTWYSKIDGKESKLLTIKKDKLKIHTASGNSFDVQKANI